MTYPLCYGAHAFRNSFPSSSKMMPCFISLIKVASWYCWRERISVELPFIIFSFFFSHFEHTSFQFFLFFYSHFMLFCCLINYLSFLLLVLYFVSCLLFVTKARNSRTLCKNERSRREKKKSRTKHKCEKRNE